MTDDAKQDLARKYDAIAYAAQAHALSHPRHLATVATLFGMRPPPVATARVLEVGCSNGANLLPMAASLPDARFTGCDLSAQAIAQARRGAALLNLANVTLEQRDLATLALAPDEYDYIVAHGVYSWVPPSVRDALFDLAARRLAPDGLLFVSYNAYPGCHVRQAVWEMLHHHVDALATPRERIDAARAFAALMAEPGATQTGTDALLREELQRVAAQTDSALFHDDLALPNDPVYFHAFNAHLARHRLAHVADAMLPMMSPAGLAPRVRAYVATLDRIAREQYLDFARMRRFRQSIACHADTPTTGADLAARAAPMHVAATMSLVRAAAEGKAFAGAAMQAPALRPTRRLLEWLVAQAPRVVPMAEVADWQRAHAPADAASGRPVAALLADACFAGTVELYVTPPAFATSASVRPVASPVARWQAGHGPSVTNLRHETLRVDDPFALRLLVMLDGHATRGALAAALAPTLPTDERAGVAARVDACLAHFALHALLVA